MDALNIHVDALKYSGGSSLSLSLNILTQSTFDSKYKQYKSFSISKVTYIFRNKIIHLYTELVETRSNLEGVWDSVLAVSYLIIILT